MWRTVSPNFSFFKWLNHLHARPEQDMEPSLRELPANFPADTPIGSRNQRDASLLLVDHVDPPYARDASSEPRSLGLGEPSRRLRCSGC
jgi:hypothetical protein